MDRRNIVYLRANARNLAAGVSMKGRVVLGLFLVGAVLIAIYTAITEKDSSLHLKVQHGFHSA